MTKFVHECRTHKGIESFLWLDVVEGPGYLSRSLVKLKAFSLLPGRFLHLQPIIHFGHAQTNKKSCLMFTSIQYQTINRPVLCHDLKFINGMVLCEQKWSVPGLDQINLGQVPCEHRLTLYHCVPGVNCIQQYFKHKNGLFSSRLFSADRKTQLCLFAIQSSKIFLLVIQAHPNFILQIRVFFFVITLKWTFFTMSCKWLPPWHKFF